MSARGAVRSSAAPLPANRIESLGHAKDMMAMLKPIVQRLEGPLAQRISIGTMAERNSVLRLIL